MRLLHLADVHLAASHSGFGDIAAERAAEVAEALRRLPDVAAEERVDAVLIAGDLFDSPQPDAETLATGREMLRRLVDLCIPAFLVPGNHDSMTLKLNPYQDLARGGRVVIDAGGPESTERAWPVADEAGQRLAEKHRAYILGRPRFGKPVTVRTENGPLHVYGVGYDGAECRDPLSTFRRHDGDGVHVVLMHASVHEASHWSSSGNGLTVPTDALRVLDVDYIALGDHHRPTLPEEFDDVPACYAGCFAATDLTQVGARGFVLVDVEPGSAPRVEHRDGGVTPVESVEVDVGRCGHDVQVAELAMHGLPPQCVPVVRLVGEPSFPLDADAVTAELRERFGHATVIDETHYLAPERLEELAAQDTVVGHVARLGRARIETSPDGEAREVAQQALRVALRALGAE